MHFARIQPNKYSWLNNCCKELAILCIVIL